MLGLEQLIIQELERLRKKNSIREGNFKFCLKNSKHSKALNDNSFTTTILKPAEKETKNG